MDISCPAFLPLLFSGVSSTHLFRVLTPTPKGFTSPHARPRFAILGIILAPLSKKSCTWVAGYLYFLGRWIKRKTPDTGFPHFVRVSIIFCSCELVCPPKPETRLQYHSNKPLGTG